MYQGHHQDGSGIQRHSAGDLYPYVLAVRERLQADGSHLRSWLIIGPDYEGEKATHQEAVSFASGLLAARNARLAAIPKPAKPAPRQRRLPDVGIEADVRGSHSVAVRERSGVKSYFVIGPRAGAEEFASHELASAWIDYLESDLHTLHRKLAENLKTA